MRQKRGAIRSTTSSSPRAQSTTSSIAAMVTFSMAAQITTLIPAVVLEQDRVRWDHPTRESGSSALSALHCWVEFTELDAGVLGRELPLGLGGGGVAPVLPGLDVALQR